MQTTRYVVTDISVRTGSPHWAVLRCSVFFDVVVNYKDKILTLIILLWFT